MHPLVPTCSTSWWMSATRACRTSTCAQTLSGQLVSCWFLPSAKPPVAPSLPGCRLQTIFQRRPTTKQVMIFSATLSTDMLHVCRNGISAPAGLLLLEDSLLCSLRLPLAAQAIRQVAHPAVMETSCNSGQLSSRPTTHNVGSSAAVSVLCMDGSLINCKAGQTPSQE